MASWHNLSLAAVTLLRLLLLLTYLQELALDARQTAVLHVNLLCVQHHDHILGQIETSRYGSRQVFMFK